MKLRCNKEGCRKEWEYKGKQKFWATCPQCLQKVKIEKTEDLNTSTVKRQYG